MFGMDWLRKRCDVKTFDEVAEEKAKKEETLKEWREKAIQTWSKVYTTSDEPSPYNTYFFEYCQYCGRFKPSYCFDQDGFIYTRTQRRCSRMRIGNAMLKKDFEDEHAVKEL